MTHYINTIEDFHAAKGLMEPVYLNSKSKGKILVPCANTLLVKTELILANTYNPNSVESSKMLLLEQSIRDNGFCFPVVAIWDEDVQKFVIIDGFHRSVIVGEDWLDCDYIPLVILNHDISQRMAATVQFNKARGVHQVDLDADVIRALLEQGLSEEDISTKLGMDMESIHRYKQLTGVAELFKNAHYSKSWDMVEREV